MWNLFWIYEGYFGFHSDVCPRTNKVKRELGFVLMALNIRKVVAQRVKIIKFIKRQFLYYFNRRTLCVSFIHLTYHTPYHHVLLQFDVFSYRLVLLLSVQYLSGHTILPFTGKITYCVRLHLHYALYPLTMINH